MGISVVNIINMDTKSICLLLLICVALVTSSPVTKAGKKKVDLVCVEEECNQQCIDQGHFGGYCEDGKCLCHFKEDTGKVPAKPDYSTEFSQLCSTMCKKKRCSSGVSEGR